MKLRRWIATQSPLFRCMPLPMKEHIGTRALLTSVYTTLNYSAGLTMDIELPHDFKEFLKLLDDKKAEYLLIGGYAVGYHGYPRATNDMDVWVAVRPDNAERLVAVLQEFGFDNSELSPDIFLQEDRIIRLGLPPMRIEIMTGISGVTFDDCYAQRITDVIDGISANIINLRDLKKNKQASKRHRDLDDLENLP